MHACTYALMFTTQIDAIVSVDQFFDSARLEVRYGGC